MVVSTFAKGKPSERVGRKTTGLTTHIGDKPAGSPEELGLAVKGEIADGPA